MIYWNESSVTGTQMELKYCERCGGLWLRRKDQSSVYCAPCEAHCDGLPKRTASERIDRQHKRNKTPRAVGERIEHITGVAEGEGRL